MFTSLFKRERNYSSDIVFLKVAYTMCSVIENILATGAQKSKIECHVREST